MKKSIRVLSFLIFSALSISAYSQKYRSVSDTGKLNAEYVKVSNDIADLTSQLTAAQNNLPKVESKANSAASDAQEAAAKSSNEAAKATNGSVGDARSAKRKAKKSLREAKDLRSADNNVSDQNKKIERLTAELNKKKGRLQELETMRSNINTQANPM